MPQKRRVLVGDFETTVYKGQEYTEVWASALVEVGKDDPNDVKVFHSINETWEYLKRLHTSVTVYYHNLKFDGSFWINFFMNDLEFKPAVNWLNDEKTQAEWLRERDMQNKTFRASISRMGQWYSITVKIWGNVIEFRDSWKLMPFSVKECGKAFNTKHRKLDMEYTGFRYAGCTITDEELAYIKNDVLVVSEALDTMFKDGHDKLTIGSCCMAEFKNIMGRSFQEIYFIPLDAEDDAWIRKAYKGGWCYVAKGKENKMHYGGGTYDVNSLYPSVMHSESGNRYPIGKPHWFKETFPIWYGNDKFYFFLKIRTRFYLKPGKLPTIQIKGNPRYHANEWLETSDYYRYGEWHEDPVELTVTQTDFKLMKEHYDLVDFELIEGCWFHTEIGLFDTYINKYREIKMNSTGARRTEAKLFLNNLYGKLATSSDSTFKIPFLREDGSLGFQMVPEFNKKTIYIPAGAAVTAYARDFTIRAAQANYYGPDKPGFIYADTDSIHLDLPPEKVKNVRLDPAAFCCWKHETSWDYAIFVRQKTYIEHCIEADEKPCDPFFLVKCAGMPEKCKQLFVSSMTGEPPNIPNFKPTKEEEKFLKTKRTIKDFKVGLKVPGKLMPKQLPGGVLLVDSEFTMKERNPFI